MYNGHSESLIVYTKNWGWEMKTKKKPKIKQKKHRKQKMWKTTLNNAWNKNKYVNK